MLRSRVLSGISGRIKRGGDSLGLIKRGYSASQGSGDTQGYVPIPTIRTADPAIHSSDPQVEVENGSDPHKPAQTPSEPEIICSGPELDPWPDDDENLKSQNKAQEEDNKEYFKDHKASPLSEIEFADTRKPITQATDTNTNVGVIVFKEEQKDTAEEALLRAAQIWNWNKMRGDPDSPHGRVLRQLRGEFW